MSEEIEQPDINLPGRLPIGKRKRSGSILPDETESMDRKRRLVQQDGHRQHLLAVVHAREHPEGKQQSTGEFYKNNPLEHPDLAPRQDQDGLPPKLISLPPEDREARRDFDNARNEKQLRMSHAPKFSTAPRPGGP